MTVKLLMRSRPHRGVADLTACLIALTLALVVLADPCVSAEHGVEMLSSGEILSLLLKSL